jgi:poly(3-hydroxybutyrate) depolymerase
LNEPIKVNAECTVTQSPYINACNYDQAQDELTHIYGKLKDRVPCADESRLIAFDQKEFVKDGATAENGLADSGYIYVPADCQPGAPGPACRLQVVLHGCEQSAETQVAGKTLGKEFVTAIGVNEWADTNRIIILYPQAKAIGLDTLLGTPWYELPDAAWELNPKGCWNWWGYSDDRQYLTKKGVQVAAIWKMIERIEGK